MELMLLALSICAAIFVGWNILYLISFKDEGLYRAESIFISYGLGVGFISLEMLAFYFFGVKYTAGRILLPWAGLLVVNIFIYSRHGIRTASKRPKSKEGHRVLRIFLIFGLALEIALSFFSALIKPIESYDAIAIYAIKSKIFYLAKSIPHDYFYNLALVFPHPDYPLNIPLFEAYIYTFLGSLNDQLVKIIFPLFYVAAIGMLYYAIRRFASKTYALLFSFLMASVPQFIAYASNGYCDLPLAFYYFTSAVFLFMWFQDTGRTRCLFISAVSSALAGWTKNEGLMYCLINFTVIAVFLASRGKKIKIKEIGAASLYVVTVALILAPFLWIRNTAQLVNSDMAGAGAAPSYILKQLCRIGPILYEFQKEFFGPKKWNILWPIAALVFIFRFRDALRGMQKYVTISLALIISGYCFVYIISPLDVYYFVGKTWSRFLIHFLPLVIYWLAVMLKKEIDI